MCSEKPSDIVDMALVLGIIIEQFAEARELAVRRCTRRLGMRRGEIFESCW